MTKLYIVNGYVGRLWREWCFRTYKLLKNAEKRYKELTEEYLMNATLEEYDLSSGERKTLKENFNIRNN